MRRYGYTPQQYTRFRLYAWKMLSPYVDYMHAKDAKYDGKVVPCGAGVGMVPHIIREYLKKGGDMITLEPHLFSFKALSTLETNPAKRNDYATADAAFNTAAHALKKIIEL